MESSHGRPTFDHALFSDKGGIILAGGAFALILLFCAAMFTLGWIVGYLNS